MKKCGGCLPFVLKRLSVFFLGAFLFLLSPSMGHAENSFINVVTEQWPPYNYEEDGIVKGIATEVVRVTLARAGLDCSICVLPWSRAYHTALDEPDTLIYSIFKLDSRQYLFKWIKIDGLSVEMYLFRPKGRDDININDLEDARAYRIGVTRDSSTHHFLRDEGFVDGQNLFPVRNEELNILQSDPSFKRIDMTTGDRLSLARWLKVAGYPADYWVKQVFLFKQDFYMAFSLDTDDAVVERTREALAELHEEGVLQEILDRHYEHYGISYED